MSALWLDARLARLAAALSIAELLGAKSVNPRRPVLRTSKRDSVLVAFVLALYYGTDTWRSAVCASARDALLTGTVSANVCGMVSTWSTMWMVMLPDVVVFVTTESLLPVVYVR